MWDTVELSYGGNLEVQGAEQALEDEIKSVSTSHEGNKKNCNVNFRHL